MLFVGSCSLDLEEGWGVGWGWVQEGGGGVKYICPICCLITLFFIFPVSSIERFIDGRTGGLID